MSKTVIKKCKPCGYYDSSGANFCTICGSELLDVSSALENEVDEIKECADIIRHVKNKLSDRGYYYDLGKLGVIEFADTLTTNIPERAVVDPKRPNIPLVPMPENTIPAPFDASKLLILIPALIGSYFLLKFIIGNILAMCVILVFGPVAFFYVIHTVSKEGNQQRDNIVRQFKSTEGYSRAVEEMKRENARRLVLKQRANDMAYIVSLEGWLKHTGRPFYGYTQHWISENEAFYDSVVKQYIEERDRKLRERAAKELLDAMRLKDYHTEAELEHMCDREMEKYNREVRDAFLRSRGVIK